MTRIVSLGEFTNPADSAFWLDLEFDVCLCGVDHKIKTATLHAFIDPTLGGAGINGVIAQAIADYATTKGYTIAANQTFLLSFARV